MKHTKLYTEINFSFYDEWPNKMAPVDEKGNIDWSEGFEEFFDELSALFGYGDLCGGDYISMGNLTRWLAVRRTEKGCRYIAKRYAELCGGELTFETVQAHYDDEILRVKIVDDEGDDVAVIYVEQDRNSDFWDGDEDKAGLVV